MRAPRAQVPVPGLAAPLGAGGAPAYTGVCHPDVHDAATAPTVLWRLTRGRSTAHATLFPGSGQTTVTWYIDGVMDRAENYASMDLAIARADHVRGILLRDGWQET